MTVPATLNGSASSIIGVIDLRGGRAVHAIAGKREQYRDVLATGMDAGDAIGLAERYQRLGVSSLYIADLDAIDGHEANIELLKRLTALAKTVLIDSGPLAPTIARTIAPTALVRFIVPTESFSSIDEWSTAVENLGSDGVVMGLDLRGHQIRTRHVAATSVAPSDGLGDNVSPWIDRAIAIGVPAVVVLDLSYVGTCRGAGTAHACQFISRRWPNLELLSGGGVRDAVDVKSLLDAGCQRVLVATALHDDDSVARLFAVD